MLSAFASSSLFLICYIVYHYIHGDTKYPLYADYRGIYLFILASHVLLSVIVVPLVLAAIYFAIQKQFITHRKIAKILYPTWLYVSVTGVLIFMMLRAANT